MKRIFAIFERDLRNSFRDFIILYMLIIPLLLAVGLHFFIPNVSSSTATFAIDNSIEKESKDAFSKYVTLELYSSRDEIDNRVKEIDDVVGIVKNPDGQFQVILEGNEGNEMKELASMIIRDINNITELPLQINASEIGFKLSPLGIYGGVFVILFSLFIGGTIIGFNIIEEKEGKTMTALNVTPMTRYDFLIGKSISGIIIPLIQVYAILWILGYTGVNKLMVLAITLTSSLIGILIGYIMGVISGNQMAGIANVKIIFTLLIITVVGAILLPEDKHFLLYWAPPYWSFLGIKGIILQSITWSNLLYNITWILGLTGIAFIGFKQKIRKGLS